MKVRRSSNLRPGLLLLAFAIAIFVWGIAHGSSSIERGFDIPVELQDLDEALVVTDQSGEQINVRVVGSRAALRNIRPEDLRYVIDVSAGKPGVAVYDVDVSRIDLPGNSRFVSHSPSRIQIRFERRGRKAVGVRADLEGEPAAGFHLAGVEISPSRVWLTGARSQVLRLEEVETETINISGLQADEEREVRLDLGSGSVWVEDRGPVKVQVRIEPDEAPAPDGKAAGVGAGKG